MARSPKPSAEITSPPGPVPRVTKGDRTRFRVLEKAIDCVAKHGFEGASFDRIAKAAGVSRPLVVHYFGTKERLLDEMVEHVLGTARGYVVAALEGVDDPWARFEVYVRANVEWTREYRAMKCAWAFFVYRGSYSRKWAALNREANRIGEGRVREIIQAGVRQRRFREEADSQAVAFALHRALYAVVITPMDPDGRTHEELVAALIEAGRQVLLPRAGG